MTDLKELDRRIDALDPIVRPYVAIQAGQRAYNDLGAQPSLLEGGSLFYRGLPVFLSEDAPDAGWSRLIDMRHAKSPEPDA